MVNSIRLYFRYVGISLLGQMQYRASFLLYVIAHFANAGVEFIGIWVLFDRFGSLQDWTLPEVALLYGIVHIGFAIADATGRGFDLFPMMVKSGDFDRLLLRPRSTALQLAGQELQLVRIGRLLQGVAVLIWAAVALDLAASPTRIALIVAAILSGACLFYGAFILQATLAFWTVETMEIMNVFTFGGVEAAQFPLSIYRPWFRRFFTFVVPLACINYFPAHAILGRPFPSETPTVLPWIAPIFGFAFLTVALLIWRIGERHYQSTGS